MSTLSVSRRMWSMAIGGPVGREGRGRHEFVKASALSSNQSAKKYNQGKVDIQTVK